MPRSLPAMCDATVVRQIPDQYRLLVSVDVLGGQIFFLPVDVATHGPRDAVRGHWPPLPAIGTRGRVSFSRSDDRSGRWEGASTPSLIDSSTLAPGDGNHDYKAHYAGDWSWRGSDGVLAEAFADGGTLLLGSAMPAPTRHVVGATGAREASVFTAAQRNPTPPAAMPLNIALANGFTLSVTAAGAATITVPAGQPLTLAVTGGASLTLAGTTVSIVGALTVTGQVTGGFGGGDQAGLTTHEHTAPGGGGTTTPPLPGT
jgi:hypothetical protein